MLVLLLAVFKTVLSLEKAYGYPYIIRILQGDDRFGLKKEIHKSFETFEELKDMSFFRIEKLVLYLVKTSYLQMRDLRYGTLSLSDKAVDLMKGEELLEIDIKELRSSWYDIQLKIELKSLRKEFSANSGIAISLK